MTTLSSEDLSRLAVGKSSVRSQRVNRALLAKMLREQAESNGAETETEADEATSEEGEGKLVRALIASRAFRRRRIRNLVLAHLLRERAEGEEAGTEDYEDSDEETGDDDNRLVRAVIGSRILRRRRARKLVLAHLLRERATGSEEEEDEWTGEDAGDDDNRLVKALIASRLFRRRRARRLILAAIARQRAEGAEDEDVDEEADYGDDGGDDDSRIVRALIGSRVLRRRRARKLLLTHLLRQGEDAD
jgi:hypothetical protein